MTKQEIKALAKELREDARNADEATYEIIIRDLNRLEKEANKQDFTIMYAMSTSGMGGLPTLA